MTPAAQRSSVLDALRWLGLEVKHLPPAREFYADRLGLAVRSADEREVRLAAGGHGLRLRRPSAVPRGGLHTHFAFATPPDRYDRWYERLSGAFDLQEARFGDARSLYLYDPDGNCVEIGQRELDPPTVGLADDPDDPEGTDGTADSDGAPDDGDPAGNDPGDDGDGNDDDGNDGNDGGGDGNGPADITGIFEVVLEVADLPASESFYADLGFRTVDRGSERRRVRMAGPVDLELWEPHLGLADARGGVHVDLGFAAADPAATVEAVADRVLAVRELDRGVRVRDPDGHWLTVLPTR